MSSFALGGISIREYLTTSYEPDCDYVDGVLEDRHVGEISHSKLQFLILTILAKISGLHVLPECRLQVSSTRYRVPDISVCLNEPEGEILTVPPFIVMEILSPEDRVTRFSRKLTDYFKMGCCHVWVFDPKLKLMYRCTELGLGLPVMALQAGPVCIEATDL